MGPSEGLFSLLVGNLGHSRSVSVYDRRRLLYYVSVLTDCKNYFKMFGVPY